MNCKQGDLAVIARAYFDHDMKYLGRVIVCAQPVTHEGVPCWIPEPKLSGIRYVADRCLKPLRDSDGTDETLSWIDVPSEVTA